MTTIMKNILSLLVLLAGALSLSAQAVHNVSVNSMSFSPSSLTINVGDTVRWEESAGGAHNVNGQTTTFPSNPESFGNAVSSVWVYKYKFNTPGTYSYRCDIHFSMGMTGTVVVTAPSSVDEKQQNGEVVLYPNPTKDRATVKLNHISGSGAEVVSYDATGKQVSIPMTQINGLLEFDTSALSKGIYVISITAGEQTITRKLVID